MDELNIISCRVAIQTTYLKIKQSLDEIKEKHGQRTDLINSMERTLLDLQEISLVYSEMEKELRSAVQQSFRLERLLQEEKFKNKDLQSQLKTSNYEI